jgi:hypothetical protein
MSNCVYDASRKASKEWQDLTSCPTSSPIPVETDGKSWTACQHWDESCLQGELMTGYISGALELSRMTVAALDDLGYSVDYSQADPYPVSKVRSSCMCSERRLEEPGDHNVFDGSNYVAESNNVESVSDSGLEAAIAYGRESLKDMAVSRKPDPNLRAIQDIEFVGDQVVFVLYMDDSDNVRNIAVENDVL